MCPSPFNILSVISIYIYLLNEWSENNNNKKKKVNVIAYAMNIFL